MPLNSSVTAFLAEKFTVATVWQSDFLHASRYVKDLVFTVPVDGTYVERVGVGLVAESRNEPVAIEFIKFIHERRDQLAKNRALLPLHAKDVDGSQVKDWRIFSDDVPLMKDYATHVQRIKREKESRAARSR
jgi:ABC-type Fe3+ transport system substrate-binding protein